MKIKIIFIIFWGIFLLNGCNNTNYSETTYKNNYVKKIKKYTIYPNKAVLKAANNYPPAIGSSLFFLEKKNNDLFFFSISDRGPNAPLFDGKLNKVIFFHPEYLPIIAKIKVSDNNAEIVDFFHVIKPNDKYYTGMPTKGIEGPSFYEMPVDSKVADITSYEEGIDAESIALDKEGNIWIGEEYEPAIIKIDGKTKKATKVYTAGNGLPEFVKYRQINRGFEALAVAPNGLVYALLEGVLDFNNDKSPKGSIIRMLEIDPKTDNVRVFAYPYDKNTYKSLSKAKIGDLTAINNHEFLLVEQGEDKSGKVRNIIYKIDISNATNIANKLTPDGLHLEYLDRDQLSKNIHLIEKTLFLDINKYGWKEEKLEGLTIIDNKTIAVTNDNDFGIEGVKLHKKCNNFKCTTYDINLPKEKQHTKLWLIELAKPFS